MRPTWVEDWPVSRIRTTLNGLCCTSRAGLGLTWRLDVQGVEHFPTRLGNSLDMKRRSKPWSGDHRLGAANKAMFMDSLSFLC